jgi:hypothetical protein
MAEERAVGGIASWVEKAGGGRRLAEQGVGRGTGGEGEGIGGEREEMDWEDLPAGSVSPSTLT